MKRFCFTVGKRPIPFGWMVFSACFSLISLSTPAAELSASQYFASTNPILDEQGSPLQGTSPGTTEFGIPFAKGALVQIYLSTDNHIYPPSASGQPHANNVLLAETHIGIGMSPKMDRPARFAFPLCPRPGGNAKVFARVFNQSSIEESSFYGDSTLFTVLSWKRQPIFVDIASTDQPLDASDADGDGLNNSWEQSIGTDPGEADTDGDSVSDAQEHFAGTDALDSESYLQISGLNILGPEYASSYWES
jgi:hypothetical protein